jgi:site-specific DNA-methyltransferase (adenine-specific)
MSRVETIGRATLYLGDCRDVLPTLGKVDAVVTDPPYGQAYKVNTFHKGGTRENAVVQRNGSTIKVHPTTHEEIDGDRAPFDPSHLIGLAPAVLIWGSHKFGHLLPKGRTLVWDKVPTGKVRSQGDGETAWHPMQKPEILMRWCLDQVGNPTSVLDPYMGSASIGIAALQAGASYIGIESVAAYFDIACKRIEDAQRQGSLFGSEAA